MPYCPKCGQHYDQNDRGCPRCNKGGGANLETELLALVIKLIVIALIFLPGFAIGGLAIFVFHFPWYLGVFAAVGYYAIAAFVRYQSMKYSYFDEKKSMIYKAVEVTMISGMQLPMGFFMFDGESIFMRILIGLGWAAISYAVWWYGCEKVFPKAELDEYVENALEEDEEEEYEDDEEEYEEEQP